MGIPIVTPILQYMVKQSLKDPIGDNINNHKMSDNCDKTFQSSVNPFINEYESIVEGLQTRQESLKSECTSLIEDIEKISKKSHVEELSKTTNLLSSIQQNLELAGSLLVQIESRVTGIEKKLGLDKEDDM